MARGDPYGGCMILILISGWDELDKDGGGCGDRD